MIEQIKKIGIGLGVMAIIIAIIGGVIFVSQYSQVTELIVASIAFAMVILIIAYAIGDFLLDR